MQQRYMDPGIGRFLSVDPVTANSGTGVNFNRYWYANNNPYKFTDPDGRIACKSLAACYGVQTMQINPAARKGSGMLVHNGRDRGEHSHGATGSWAAGASGSWEAWKPASGAVESVCVECFMPIFRGMRGLGAARGLATAETAVNFSRGLRISDLGVRGTIQELRGTFSVQNGMATMHIDMIRGQILNPLEVIKNMTSMARASGATTLRIEGTIANERLYNVLQARYGMTTNGAIDVVTIPIK